MTTHTHQTAPTQFVEVNGIRFAYRRFGKAGGVPIVFNQYYVGTMDYWDPAVTNGLARDREVILFNNADVSSSSGEVPTTFEEMGANAVAFIKALGLTQIDVLGISIGGFVAQEIALQAPGLVRKLILVGTGPRGGEGMATPTPEAQQIFGATYDPQEHLWLAVHFGPSEKAKAAGLEFLKRKHLRQVDRDPEVNERVGDLQIEAIVKWGVQRAGSYELVVNGSEDLIIYTVNSFILQQNIPNAQLIIYPDANHGSPYQYPASRSSAMRTGSSSPPQDALSPIRVSADAPRGELSSCAVCAAQGRRYGAARADGPRHLLPLQGRLRLLQHPRRRRARGERRLDLRGPPRGGHRDQGPRRVLPRPGRCDRGAAGPLEQIPPAGFTRPGCHQFPKPPPDGSPIREPSVAPTSPPDREPEGSKTMTTLSGKTALVTGASRGIGRASALALAKKGAQVLVHYGQGKAEAESVVEEIREAGGKAQTVTADLAAADGAHKLAQQVRAIVGDRLDILVANAGVSKAAPIEETTVEDFDRLFAVNVRAPFFLVQQLLPILHEGSSIVFLSSLAARASVGTIYAYAATKGAIDTLVKHFAAALGSRGIRVNAVAPGVVQTDMSNFTKTDAGRDFTLGMRALKRLAEPKDIGGVIAFLASDEARWITGDTVHADGGSKL
jgi:3-oxoacyl-[acyl-carrier protein] reductase